LHITINAHTHMHNPRFPPKGAPIIVTLLYY